MKNTELDVASNTDVQSTLNKISDNELKKRRKDREDQETFMKNYKQPNLLPEMPNSDTEIQTKRKQPRRHDKQPLST